MAPFNLFRGRQKISPKRQPNYDFSLKWTLIEFFLCDKCQISYLIILFLKDCSHFTDENVCVLSCFSLVRLATLWAVAHQALLQVGILEWIAISFSRGSSQLRDPPHIFYVSSIGSKFFTTSATWEAHPHLTDENTVAKSIK